MAHIDFEARWRGCESHRRDKHRRDASATPDDSIIMPFFACDGPSQWRRLTMLRNAYREKLIAKGWNGSQRKLQEVIRRKVG